MDRRHFLQLASGTTVLTVLAPQVLAQNNLKTTARLRMNAWTASGQPFPQAVLRKTYFLDLQDEPLQGLSGGATDGTLWAEPPNIPFAIALNLAVKGFGQVTLYADNDGKGYRPADFPLNLNLACARSRIHRVRQALETWRQTGYQASPQVETQLERAAAYLKRAEQAPDPAQMAGWANESLRESLWVGETVVFEQAQQQIQRNGPRPDFLFGCNSWGHPHPQDAYNQAFKNLFNFSTLPLYWKTFEPTLGQPNFAQLDGYIDWLDQNGITPKGHPLVWFHEAGVPDWLRGQSYEKVRELTQAHVTQVTRYFGDRMSYYDIINEAHDIAWANELNFSSEEFLEMTRVASKAAADGFNGVQRIVNTCCTWAEYIPTGAKQKPLKSAYRYLQDCIVADIPFEIMGIQLYYPHKDMFEINRLLERFSSLGKPIHITELGVSSSTKRDETSYLKDVFGLWHEPWSEKVQADWIEQFYTVCYSKPYIKAISWWDLPDGGFWPHGGLVNVDLQPKESYLRLQRLIRHWQHKSA